MVYQVVELKISQALRVAGCVCLWGKANHSGVLVFLGLGFENVFSKP
ncbi:MULTISPECIES: hypothetical protein [unclassified Pseudodesulfovibrio]|nr:MULTISPECIES: hypothetical protein [unclassified Pseudodesulfovibrio]MCJ2164883.1 hypothetical protein [Pseudodesulfovibrio sp. S3-i]